MHINNVYLFFSEYHLKNTKMKQNNL